MTNETLIPSRRAFALKCGERYIPRPCCGRFAQTMIRHAGRLATCGSVNPRSTKSV